MKYNKKKLENLTSCDDHLIVTEVKFMCKEMKDIASLISGQCVNYTAKYSRSNKKMN